MNDDLLKYHIEQTEKGFEKLDKRFDGIDVKLETLNNERLIRIGVVSVLSIIISAVVAFLTK